MLPILLVLLVIVAGVAASVLAVRRPYGHQRTAVRRDTCGTRLS